MIKTSVRIQSLHIFRMSNVLLNWSLALMNLIYLILIRFQSSREAILKPN